MSTYPFDYTAEALSNKVTTKFTIATIGLPGQGYLVIPPEGPFYRQGFSLLNADMEALQEGMDFIFVFPCTQARDHIGKDVYGGFIFTNPTASGDFVRIVQSIGGSYVDDKPTTISDGIKALSAVASVNWSSFPETLPPTPHSEPLDNFAGATQVYEGLQAIGNALADPLIINLEDVNDVKDTVVDPLLANMAAVVTALQAGYNNAAVINGLQTKMLRLHPLTSAPPESDTHYNGNISGFVQMRIFTFTYTPPASPTSIPFVNPFTTKCIGCTVAVYVSDPDDETPGRHQVHFSHPKKTGIDAIEIVDVDADPLDVRPRTVFVTAYGI